MQSVFLRKIVAFFGIEFNPVNHLEKILSALGGFLGILMVFWVSEFFIDTNHSPLIIASFGASAVLLFAVPHGALSQPWPLLGGHLVSALVGITCFKLIPHTLIASALAVALAIAAMHYLRCIHPPGGATALTAVIGGPSIQSLGYYYLLTPVLLNAVIILLIAIIFNAFFPWRRYPTSLHRKETIGIKTSPESTPISRNDLEYALKRIDSFIDVTSEDLVNIYELATQHHSEFPHMQSSAIKLNSYYSNGQYGHQWIVRQVIAEFGNTDAGQDMITYKIIVGEGRRTTQNCTREEFAQWARYEVMRDENSWRPVEK
ncbi:MAG: hypothetical protein BWK79_18535 [Beggiatoa sp. IS2]|nr:MAG: hypothetical protein BWK79_18535 [Beggiatoa sp. IS2]